MFSEVVVGAEELDGAGGALRRRVVIVVFWVGEGAVGPVPALRFAEVGGDGGRSTSGRHTSRSWARTDFQLSNWTW